MYLQLVKTSCKDGVLRDRQSASAWRLPAPPKAGNLSAERSTDFAGKREGVFLPPAPPEWRGTLLRSIPVSYDLLYFCANEGWKGSNSTVESSKSLRQVSLTLGPQNLSFSTNHSTISVTEALKSKAFYASQVVPDTARVIKK